MIFDSVLAFYPTTTVNRTYAVSLGSLAMAVIVLRGLIHGEPIDAVLQEALVKMVVFMAIGAMAGWIAEHLVRDQVESTFRNRVEWYRNGVLEAERSRNDSSNQ